MFFSYPAIFYKNINDEGYYVYFLDFKTTGTQGSTKEEALYMASDWLGIMVADDLENNRDLPQASEISKIDIEKSFPFDEEMKKNCDFENSFVNLVLVNIEEYLSDVRTVKKTLTIPSWVNKIGMTANLNFSKLLTDAIVNKTVLNKKAK